MNTLRSRIAKAFLPRNEFGDLTYHFLQFCIAHKRLPRNVANFTDELFSLKRNGRLDEPLRRFVSDKYLVKIFIAGVVGSRYNVPTLGVLSSDSEIDRFAFTYPCVIKPTHASGRVMFCDSEDQLDKSVLKDWLRLDYYITTRERNYRDLTPRVIVEPLIFSKKNNWDYKFHCHRGSVRFVHVDVDRESDHKRAFFDREFVKKPFSIGYPEYTGAIERPKKFDEMISVAEALAGLFSTVRIDMYEDSESIMIGEITNVHGNAHERFSPIESEKMYGPLFCS